MSEINGIQKAPTSDSLTERLVAALKRREKALLLVGVSFQLLVLLGMTGVHAYALWRGDVYWVRVRPVDPRDLFRGDYVILGYSFSRLPTEWMNNPQAQPGRTIYVELVPEGDGRHWQAGRFRFDQPHNGPYLRGKITNWGRVEYGIESYYVQEGQGRRYEQAVRTNHLSAEIAVTPNGDAALRGLHVSP